MTKIQSTMKKGFGIAEVLIASTIIVMIIFALVAAGRSALRSAIYLHERAQATYLAQGAIEGLRQIRDTKWIDASSTTNFDQFTALAVDSSKQRVINFNSISGIYQISDQSGSNEIIALDNVDFHRTINFYKINSDQPASLLPTDTTSLSAQKATSVQAGINSVKVTVKITWDNGGQQKEINVSEILTNWRPDY